MNAPFLGAAGQPLEQTSTVLLLNGSLRLHNTTSSSSSSSLAAGPGASAAASKAASSPSKRGLFRGRSQRTAQPSTGPSAAAAEALGGVSAAVGDGQGQYGSMRQYSAPALLAWGPQLFDTMEDRWGGVGWGVATEADRTLLLCVLCVVHPAAMPAHRCSRSAGLYPA